PRYPGRLWPRLPPTGSSPRSSCAAPGTGPGCGGTGPRSGPNRPVRPQMRCAGRECVVNYPQTGRRQIELTEDATMRDAVPSAEQMTALVGTSLYEIWNQLCALIEEKYDMDSLWNQGGKAWTYEYKY